MASELCQSAQVVHVTNIRYNGFDNPYWGVIRPDFSSATKTETIPAGSCPSAGFTDVPGEGNWAHAGIDYCVANGLMSGVGDNLFAPKMTTTRAQIVQILYNLEASESSGTMPFTDLTQTGTRMRCSGRTRPGSSPVRLPRRLRPTCR